jgi:hypothetical protein
MDPYAAAFDPYGGFPLSHGLPGAQGFPPQQHLAPQPQQFAQQQQQQVPSQAGGGVAMGGIGGAAAPDLSGPMQTIVIPVPDALIGSVIGRGGLIIREIRQRSR